MLKHLTAPRLATIQSYFTCHERFANLRSRCVRYFSPAAMLTALGLVRTLPFP
jgi:hypothetical protein